MEMKFKRLIFKVTEKLGNAFFQVLCSPAFSQQFIVFFLQFLQPIFLKFWNPWAKVKSYFDIFCLNEVPVCTMYPFYII